MITCKYCGIHYEEFRSLCPACGAPLQIEVKAAAEKTEAQLLADKIREICNQYLDRDFREARDFKDGESIPEKRLELLMKTFTVFPGGKEIFFYCDTTPLGNGKRGFLICEDGVYWQNGWVTPTNRNFIPWKTFGSREITLKKFDLELGRGDVIEMSGLGSDVLRGGVASLFKRILEVLKEQAPATPTPGPVW